MHLPASIMERINLLAIYKLLECQTAERTVVESLDGLGVGIPSILKLTSGCMSLSGSDERCITSKKVKKLLDNLLEAGEPFCLPKLFQRALTHKWPSYCDQ